MRKSFPPRSIGGFQLLSVIDRGFYSTVYEGYDPISQSKVAVKQISKDNTNRQQFQQEVSIMYHLDYPNIPPIYHALEDELNYYIIMELVEGVTLLSFVTSNVMIGEIKAQNIFGQLVRTIDYLHNTANIMHRDLKLENIIIDNNDNVFIIDYGLSVHFDKSKNKFDQLCGSSAYMSPEMLIDKSYTEAVDVWSLGVILYSLAYGHLPFNPSDKQGIFKKILFTEAEFIDMVSLELIDLLKRMLIKEPSHRISLQEVKEHQWFKIFSYDMKGSSYNNGYPSIKDISPYLIDDLCFDRDKLIDDITNNRMNEYTARYRILRRKEIRECIRLVSFSPRGRAKSLQSSSSNNWKGLKGNRITITPKIILEKKGLVKKSINSKSGHFNHKPLDTLGFIGSLL